MAKKDIDWEKVETAYRAGFFSLREIAQSYGISEGAIRKRAKTHNWQRDLGNKINQRATVIMQREMAKKLPHERDIVEANALLVSEVGLSHKLLATQAREKGTALLQQFETEANEYDLAMRTRIFKEMLASLESAVKLERVAFGLDKNDMPPDQQQNNLIVSFVQPTQKEEIIVHD